MRKYSKTRKYRTEFSKHKLPEKYVKKPTDNRQTPLNVINTVSTFVKKLFNK
jgi:hypothetical protein